MVPVSGGGTERQVTLLADFGASVLCATPSYALNIAEVAVAMGVDLRRAPLRVGVFGAEPWSEATRRNLEERLGIAAVDVYGLSEILGPGVACECHSAQAGLHGWEDHFLFEIVDPETLQPMPMGESGELVITTLTKEALPMVRYRTRDITRLNDEPCMCGRTHVRIMRVTGRDDDMLIIRGVNVFPSQVEAVLVGFPSLAPHYQIVLTREGALDAMTVEVEMAPDAPIADGDRPARPRSEQAHQVADRRNLRRRGQVTWRSAALARQGGAGARRAQEVIGLDNLGAAPSAARRRRSLGSFLRHRRVRIAGPAVSRLWIFAQQPVHEIDVLGLLLDELIGQLFDGRVLR